KGAVISSLSIPFDEIIAARFVWGRAPCGEERRVETGALARPSRAQLGNCLRSQQLWVRYRLSNSLTVAMPVCGSRQSRTCVRTMCVCGIPDIHPQTFPP